MCDGAMHTSSFKPSLCHFGLGLMNTFSSSLSQGLAFSGKFDKQKVIAW